jgi:hypothetical protein
MILKCAWCNETMKDLGGRGGKDSHGICHECREKYFPETLRTVRENAAAIILESRKGRELR